MSQQDHTKGDYGGAEEVRESRSLARIIKPVVLEKNDAGMVDPEMVSPRFYSAFNYSILSKDRSAVHMAVGITSANRGEGKTLVASNLAVSLATVNERDTVLVDLNIAEPRLHAVFGTPLSPGLTEAIIDPTIRVQRTRVPHLFILSAGKFALSPLIQPQASSTKVRDDERSGSTTLGIEQIAEFRNILISLRQEFEFVIVDMPSFKDPEVPVLLSQQMDGVLIVVDANQTRKEDVDRVFRRIRESNVLGFVFNGASEDLFQ